MWCSVGSRRRRQGEGVQRNTCQDIHRPHVAATNTSTITTIMQWGVGVVVADGITGTSRR
jgi:hypothetical protein